MRQRSGVPFLLDRSVKRLYEREFTRLQLLDDSQRRSQTERHLDIRLGDVQRWHRSSLMTALHKADAGRVYGFPPGYADVEPRLGAPWAGAALERTLLEPWAQRLVHMTAEEVLAYETERDRRWRELARLRGEQPPPPPPRRI